MHTFHQVQLKIECLFIFLKLNSITDDENQTLKTH